MSTSDKMEKKGQTEGKIPYITPESSKEKLTRFVIFATRSGLLTNEAIKKILNFQLNADLRMGQLALLKGFLNQREVLQIIRAQESSEGRFGEIAFERKDMTKDEILLLLIIQNSAFDMFLECIRITETVPELLLETAILDFNSGVDPHSLNYSELKNAPSAENIITSRAIQDAPKTVKAQEVQEKIRKIKDLTTLPTVSQKLLALLSAAHVDLREVIKVVKIDPSLSARILRMVNSACFGMKERVARVDQGIMAMGTDGVKKVVIAASSMECFKNVEVKTARSIWTHGLTTAVWSQTLAKHRGLKSADQEDAFLGGLLHDIGRLAIAQHFPILSRAIDLQTAAGTPRLKAEKEKVFLTHPEIGSLLCEAWKFPESLCDCVSYHHTEPRILQAHDCPKSALLVNAGCALAHLPRLVSPKESAPDSEPGAPANQVASAPPEPEQANPPIKDSEVPVSVDCPFEEEFMNFHQLEMTQILELQGQVLEEVTRMASLIG